MATGALFQVRGFARNLLGVRWAMAPPLRYLSSSVDLEMSITEADASP